MNSISNLFITCVGCQSNNENNKKGIPRTISKEKKERKRDKIEKSK